LTDADRGGEVDDGVDAVERAANGVAIAHVADPQIDLRVQVFGSLPCRVYLLVEVVERPTSCPSAKSRSARCEPIKPAPPVIKTRMAAREATALWAATRIPAAALIVLILPGLPREKGDGGMKHASVALAFMAAILAALVAATVTASARAATGCDPAYTLTSGGVARADLNGDGLTCELTTVDAETTYLLALDNGPSVGTTGCPDDFDVTAWPTGVKPDRNGNGFVCRKVLPQIGPPECDCTVLFIDDILKNP
jgi:hypothetical protein